MACGTSDLKAISAHFALIPVYLCILLQHNNSPSYHVQVPMLQVQLRQVAIYKEDYSRALEEES
jgi:hypothetical protein